jgi:hypothetical protein
MITRHCGAPGTRDFPSVENRNTLGGMNRVFYESVAALATALAYAYGIAKAHGFVDGHKVPLSRQTFCSCGSMLCFCGRIPSRVSG